jgi:hypothetical protein
MNRITLLDFLKNAALLAAVATGMWFFMDWAVWAFDHEDCHKMQSWQDRGHPVIIPDYCDEFLGGAE